MQPQERSRQNRVAILFLIAAVAVILLFASGLSTVRLSPGGSLNVFAALTELMSPPDVERPAPSDLSSMVDGRPIMGAARFAFWTLLTLTLIYAFVSPQFRRQLIRTAVLIAGMIFLLNRLREAMTQETLEETQTGIPGQPPPASAGAVLPDPPALVTSTPDWIVWTINILVALAVIALIWFLWRKLRPQAEEDGAQVRVARQAKAALSELEQGGNLRDVILRCYSQMSDVLHENNNVYRHSAMTARDFEEHLAELGFDDEHIGRLTRLFEAARYSPGTPGPEAQEEAVACLTAIVQEYSRDSDTTDHHSTDMPRGPGEIAAASLP